MIQADKQARKDIPGNSIYERVDRTLKSKILHEKYIIQDNAARIIQRAVKKYIYGPGMSGSSRAEDSYNNIESRKELRKRAFLLVNRMKGKDLLWLIQTMGKSHNIK